MDTDESNSASNDINKIAGMKRPSYAQSRRKSEGEMRKLLRKKTKKNINDVLNVSKI